MSEVAISITAIVVSGVVGPALGAWWSRSRQRADHRVELAKELRDVLDEGAHALGRGKRAYERLYGLHKDGVPRIDPQAIEAFAARRQNMQAVRYADDRIAIRLGSEHPVHLAFGECVETLDMQRDLARAYELGRPTEAPLERQRLAHKMFDPARRRFVSAAKAIVAADVA